MSIIESEDYSVRLAVGSSALSVTVEVTGQDVLRLIEAGVITLDSVLANEASAVLLGTEAYEELLESDEVLSALHAGGVDNWEWYDESLSSIREKG